MQAWKEIYGLDTNLDVIQHHGNTDPLILIRVAEFHGIAKSDVGDSCKFCQPLSNDATFNLTPNFVVNCNRLLLS